MLSIDQARYLGLILDFFLPLPSHNLSANLLWLNLQMYQEIYPLSSPPLLPLLGAPSYLTWIITKAFYPDFLPLSFQPPQLWQILNTIGRVLLKDNLILLFLRSSQNHLRVSILLRVEAKVHRDLYHLSPGSHGGRSLFFPSFTQSLPKSLLH